MNTHLMTLAAAAAATVGLGACGGGAATGRSGAAAPAATSAGAPSARTITASATGTVEGAPDLLTITIGVQTQAPRAQAALADNNTKAAAVIAKLEAGGVAAKDVQTTQLSVSPVYASPSPVITGYQVSDLVTAKLRNLDSAGAVIDDAASAAGDAARIDGISFSINDDSALLAEARASAVKQASDRAKAMAVAAGVNLGPVQSITDLSVQTPDRFAGLNQAAGAATPSVPLQPGSQEVSVQVEVVYQIG